jgi:hypothetical protein
MAVHASRVSEHLAEFGEQRGRALVRLGDRGKAWCARPLDTASEAASAVQTIVSTLISATTEMTI